MDPSYAVKLAHRRMASSLLSTAPSRSPEEVVEWFGAIQAQEYEPAKWSIASRTTGIHSTDLDDAIDDGRILRTHALRPTWHFVRPEDIGWVQKLTGPRVHVLNGHYYKLHGLDESMRARTDGLIANWISNEGDLSRDDIGRRLEAEGIEATGNRLAYVLMSAELNGVVCSGRRDGTTHTYGLVSQRALGAKDLTEDEALAELTFRYFRSHGPATVNDMRWWSSLTVSQIRRGLEMLDDRVRPERVGDLELWSLDGPGERAPDGASVHLLQPYDEYTVAFSDTKAVITGGKANERPPVLDGRAFYGSLIVDSQLAGWWRRTLGSRDVQIEVRSFQSLSRATNDALHDVANDYGRFQDLPVSVMVETI